MELEEYIRVIYEACESHPCCNDADILHTREKLEKAVEGLEFRKQDHILSTVNELCADYDYSGFLEGFRRGAELALELTYQ